MAEVATLVPAIRHQLRPPLLGATVRAGELSADSVLTYLLPRRLPTPSPRPFARRGKSRQRSLDHLVVGGE